MRAEWTRLTRACFCIAFSVGDDWPQGGEIDIVEQGAFHTALESIETAPALTFSSSARVWRCRLSKLSSQLTELFPRPLFSATQNQYTLHTNPGCTLSQPMLASGEVLVDK